MSSPSEGAHSDVADHGSGNSLYAALGRTVTRSLALYFSRPVRLFRPAKVSGWMSLRSLANRDGSSLSPQYFRSLVKQHGIGLFPRHFLPPLAVNAFLGTVLWTTYHETSLMLENYMSHPLAISSISGGVAGGMQAIVAAPAENVRLIIEGTSHTHSEWTTAWRHVFLGSSTTKNMSRAERMHEARLVGQWMKEVGEMAGRGWNGWTWGFAKDVCGFSAFFSLFELTRHSAQYSRRYAERTIDDIPVVVDGRLRRATPRIVHGATLVTGGVAAGLAYELCGRPWDVARKIVHVDNVTRGGNSSLSSVTRALVQEARREGILSYFREPHPSNLPETRYKRLYTFLRVIARVGPWGAGFLLWEAFGPGLDMKT